MFLPVLEQGNFQKAMEVLHPRENGIICVQADSSVLPVKYIYYDILHEILSPKRKLERTNLILVVIENKPFLIYYNGVIPYASIMTDDANECLKQLVYNKELEKVTDGFTDVAKNVLGIEEKDILPCFEIPPELEKVLEEANFDAPLTQTLFMKNKLIL